ncbi:hypothetical protein ACJROX_05915 [Pseudalkalibacillus sp. A8]|uniref:hypothetical protein n=1 Tax=Pseudalkalibacillus sp. A8 TaxID=3382641 RepID=UPI0038B59D20
MKEITVVGTGNVAMRSGLELVRLGHKVTCLQEQRDTKALLISQNNNMELTNDKKSTYKNSSIIFLDVEIPILGEDEVDMSEVEEILNDISEFARHDFTLVINSEVPVGTNKWILNQLREKFSGLPIRFDVVTKTDLSHINGKIVIGTHSENSAETIDAIYETYRHKIMHTTPENAEFFNFDLAYAN